MDTESIPGSRHSNLKKSFKRGLRSLLTACSEEEFRKAFPSFAAAEQERLHRLFIRVITYLHEHVEEEFESILLETQVGNVLDSIEELVDEHSLDPLISKKSNVAETVLSLSEAKKNEVQYLMGMLKKAEEQRCSISARFELLKKEKQDISGAVNLVDELRTAILNYSKAPHSSLVNKLFLELLFTSNLYRVIIDRHFPVLKANRHMDIIKPTHKALAKRHALH